MTGLLELSAADYHADLIDDERPSLSKSLIQILLNASPAHARHAHPRLNPNFERREEAKFDVGNAVHQVFLEGIDAVAVIPFDSWRTAAAKEERDVARAAGKIPMLPQDYDRVDEMHIALRAQLATLAIDPPLFTDGRSEVTITWEDRGVLCRARLDWWRDDHTACDDLKTTSRSANPKQWTRNSLWSIGADVQQAFYLRGIRAVLDADPVFRFLVAESSAPYAISFGTLAPDALALANAKVDAALDLWRDCLEKDEWPSYPQRMWYAEAPAWELARWMEGETA